MTRAGRPPRRGRPPKFGRPGQLVAITLPAEVVQGLRRINADLAWAIVQLFERRAKRRTAARGRRPDAELVSVANGRSLIVVNGEVLKHLPGVSLIPLHDDRAFLAFDPNASLADLELAVIDRLEKKSITRREREALAALRDHVHRWRRDPKLHCEQRSIIVLEELAAVRRRRRSTPQPAAPGSRGRSAPSSSRD